jgi:hypothetical protein
MEIQGNHENKENNGVETQSHMGSILSQFESTNTESQNHSFTSRSTSSRFQCQHQGTTSFQRSI